MVEVYQGQPACSNMVNCGFTRVGVLTLVVWVLIAFNLPAITYQLFAQVKSLCKYRPAKTVETEMFLET